MRTYAIGDIHGHLELLRGAQTLVAQDRARVGDSNAPLVHIGDLTDRGPESAGVIAHLLAGMAAGKPWVALKGNHDRMFARFLADPVGQDPGLSCDYTWLDPRLGGQTTLASYGVPIEGLPRSEIHKLALARVPLAHQRFLQNLKPYLLRGEALFVHAGIRPGVPLDEQTEDDLVWIRSPFLEDRRDHGPLIVHGHTALDAVTHFGNRLDIDSGAAYGRALAAVVIEGRDVWLLGPNGRTPVLPGEQPARPVWWRTTLSRKTPT